MKEMLGASSSSYSTVFLQLKRLGISSGFGGRRASLVAQQAKNLATMWEAWVQSLVGKMPWRRERLYPLQYSGLENSMDCIVRGVAKSQI